MAQSLRLLIIEDAEDDALLLVRELRKAEFDPDFVRVETPHELETALESGPWDAVIADYSLPAFTGLDALRIIRAKGLDLPFILVSGVIGEEKAVEAMKAGAHDYIMKGNYPRLGPALERELGDAAVRRERRQAEDALRLAHAELEQRVAERTAEIKAANTLLRDSRRAALNMMEDALAARRQAEQASAELQREVMEHKRAEKALRESELFYRQTLDSIPGMVFTTRPDGYCDYQSQQWVDFTGVPMIEHLGDGWNKLLHPDDRPRAFAAWRAAVEERAPYDLEYRVRRHDGVYEWFKVRGRPIRNAAGEIVRWFGTVLNIDHLLKADEALRESEERVRLKLDSILSPEGDIGTLDLADIIDARSLQSLVDDFYELSGMPMGLLDVNGKVLVGVGWQDVCTKFHRVNPQTCRNCLESDLQLSAGVPHGEYKIYRCKNNLWDVATPVMVGDRQFGNLFMGQFFFEDEPLDYELFRSQASQYGFDEKEYIAALEAVPRLSRETLNTSMAFFMKLADILSQLSYSNIKLARSLAERDTLMDSLRSAHAEMEKRVAERTVELATTVNVLQEEIAEHRDAKDTILRLNRLYTVLSETNQAIVRAGDRDTLFHEVCRIAVEHGGFLLAWVGLTDGATGLVKPAASHGETSCLADLRIPVNAGPEGLGPIGIVIRDGSFFISNDFLADPATRPWHECARTHGFEASASIALKLNGAVIGALNLYAGEKEFFKWQFVQLLQQMAADISFALDNMERETRLRESEKKYRALFEESKDVIYIMDADQRLVDVNPAGCELFGYTKEELFSLDIGRELYFDPAEREPFLRTLLAKGYVREFDSRMRKKGGEVLQVLKTATVIRTEQGELAGYRGIIHDITERKRLEQQLLQSQKMESIGLLAGGVAHDFNNLLTAISGYGQIIQEQYAAGDEMLGMCIEQIISATNRAVELTRNLLAFSRKQIINPYPLQVDDIVISMSKLLVRIIGEDIEFSSQFSDKPLTVMADKGQIDQVLVNLATNARDAMPQGGRLLIRTGQAMLDEEMAKRLDLGKEGAYALITVADTGQGMDRETLEKIFEPFYTTKETGKGTGLGLSIIYGIIKQHNGAITVASEPGKGSTFAIYLPLVEAVAGEERAAEAAVPARGAETLLLAEDDAMVRKYMKQILEMAGYTVITAQNGAEAVGLFRENRDRVALVVCDVVMPKKNGKEVYDEIRAMNPEARFLFVSGYNDEIIHTKGILLEDFNLLTKPVNRQQLLAKLREMLE